MINLQANSSRQFNKKMTHHFLEVIHLARDPGEIQNLLKGIKNMIVQNHTLIIRNMIIKRFGPCILVIFVDILTTM
jgi:hypothetical protein